MHIVKRTGHTNWVMRDYIAYWDLQFVQTYKIKFPTDGHTIIYTCLHVISKPNIL